MMINGWKNISNEAREMTNEIVTTRRQPGAGGDILWHSKPLMTNHAGVADALRRSVYSQPALVPACPWLEGSGPVRPVLTVRESRKEMKLNWTDQSATVWQWVIWKKAGSRWTTEILPAAETKEIVPLHYGSSRPDVIAVAAVSRYGNLSEAAVFNTAHLER